MGRKNNRSKKYEKTKGTFLYGNINSLHNAKAFCVLHDCYLSANDIKIKKCNYKRCDYLKELE